MLDLQGYVDYFDGLTVYGWAADAANPEKVLSVDIYLDDALVTTVRADGHREDLRSVSPDHPDKAFCHTFEPPLTEERYPLVLHRLPRITVKFSRTDRCLLPAPSVLGVVNEDSIGVAEALCLDSDNRFMPTPPAQLIEHVAGSGTSNADYRAVGTFLMLDLMHFGLVTDPACTVLDLGCGCGRLATHLAPLIAHRGGRYHGFDTWAAGVSWATEHITAVYPSFRFHRLEATRRAEDEDPGYVGDSAYSLTVDDESCDLVVASSVLTHLTRDAAVSYLKEFRRVLRPRGWAYVTVFIYDDEARELVMRRAMKTDRHASFLGHRDYFDLEGLSGGALQTDAHGAYFRHPGYFDAYFTEETLAAALAETGFSARIKRYGHWRGDHYRRGRRHGFQDLLILRPNG